MGTELFSRRGVERYTKENVTVVNDDGTTSVVPVYHYQEEDPSDVYTMYTTSQLVLNPTVGRDSSTLPTMYSDKSDGKKGYANNELLGIAQAFDESIGTLNPNSLTTYDIKHFYAGTVNTIDNERQNVMGVCTDEELSNMIKYQQCYNASSRYITTVAEMLEYLIERLGG